jgi:hypothetical protein
VSGLFGHVCHIKKHCCRSARRILFTILYLIRLRCCLIGLDFWSSRSLQRIDPVQSNYLKCWIHSIHIRSNPVQSKTPSNPITSLRLICDTCFQQTMEYLSTPICICEDQESCSAVAVPMSRATSSSATPIIEYAMGHDGLPTKIKALSVELQSAPSEKR